MNIAIYAGMFEKDQDGATKTLYELTDSLLKRKIKVSVWAFATSPPIKQRDLSIFKLWGVPLPFYPKYKFTFPFPSMKYNLNQFKPDLIHIAVPDLVGIYLIRYAKNNKIPIVISYHTDFPAYLKYYNLNIIKKPGWRYLRWFYNNANVVFVPTLEVKRALMNKKIKNTKIWSRGIHLSKFNPLFRSTTLRTKWRANEKKVILYSGRFTGYKDLDVFLKVYQLFNSTGPHNIVFVLIGEGPLEKKLKRNMPDAIFPGYLNGKELSEAYASADILLFPSTTETFGNVIKESLASGVPVVVSDVGGCKEVVNDSQGGLIARANDANSFYNCCTQLVSDEDLYKKLRVNALTYFKDRTWEKINESVISEYYRLVKIPISDKYQNN